MVENIQEDKEYKKYEIKARIGLVLMAVGFLYIIYEYIACKEGFTTFTFTCGFNEYLFGMLVLLLSFIIIAIIYFQIKKLFHKK